jgi:hypothetical protein
MASLVEHTTSAYTSPSLSSIKIKLLPMLIPRLLIRQQISNRNPHLTRNPGSLPAHHAALLPLFFDLFALAGRDLRTLATIPH